MKSHSALLLLGVLSTTVLTAPTLSPTGTSGTAFKSTSSEEVAAITLADLPYDLIDAVNKRLDPLSSKTLQLLTNKELFGLLRRTDQEEELFAKMRLLNNDKEFFWAIVNGDNDAVRRSMSKMEGPSLLLGLELAVQYGNAEAQRLFLVWDTLSLEECNDKRKKLGYIPICGARSWGI